VRPAKQVAKLAKKQQAANADSKKTL